MKKILVPIDFSDNSEYILNKALEYIHQEEFEIILIHVTSADIGFIIGEVGYQYLPELEETALENESKQLQKISSDLNDAFIGSVSKTILKNSKIPVLLIPIKE